MSLNHSDKEYSEFDAIKDKVAGTQRIDTEYELLFSKVNNAMQKLANLPLPSAIEASQALEKEDWLEFLKFKYSFELEEVKLITKSQIETELKKAKTMEKPEIHIDQVKEKVKKNEKAHQAYLERKKEQEFLLDVATRFGADPNKILEGTGILDDLSVIIYEIMETFAPTFREILGETIYLGDDDILPILISLMPNNQKFLQHFVKQTETLEEIFYALNSSMGGTNQIGKTLQILVSFRRAAIFVLNQNKTEQEEKKPQPLNNAQVSPDQNIANAKETMNKELKSNSSHQQQIEWINLKLQAKSKLTDPEWTGLCGLREQLVLADIQEKMRAAAPEDKEDMHLARINWLIHEEAAIKVEIEKYKEAKNIEKCSELNFRKNKIKEIMRDEIIAEAEIRLQKRKIKSEDEKKSHLSFPNKKTVRQLVAIMQTKAQEEKEVEDLTLAAFAYKLHLAKEILKQKTELQSDEIVMKVDKMISKKNHAGVRINPDLLKKYLIARKLHSALMRKNQTLPQKKYHFRKILFAKDAGSSKTNYEILKEHRSNVIKFFRAIFICFDIGGSSHGGIFANTAVQTMEAAKERLTTRKKEFATFPLREKKQVGKKVLDLKNPQRKPVDTAAKKKPAQFYHLTTRRR